MRSLLVAAIATLAPVLAAGQEPAWQSELTDEIAQSENCEVKFLSQVVERTVNGQSIIMAKAHCLDDRVFDAWRDDPAAPFSFKECPTSAQSTVC